MNFISAKELLELCERDNITISQAMINRETQCLGGKTEELYERMERALAIMRDGVRLSLSAPQKSMGGLIGGEAIKLTEHRSKGKAVCGDMMSKAVTYAMGMLEVNASMGLIVAAPTAGSCGVLPAALLAQQEEFSFSDKELFEVMFTASAVGYIIARNATISGAEGGCQAEVGAASAMAAAAVTQLHGGSPAQCLHAAGIAIVNILGLVCDPIRGLVEVPCQTRNAMGVSNALVAAELALSGIHSPAPFDEVVATMASVGRSLPCELRETALGGIACAPSAIGS